MQISAHTPLIEGKEIHMNITKVKNENGKVGEGIKFERIRRITGYLVGTLDRFGDAKRSEVEERVKHGLSGSVTKKKNRDEC